VKNEHHISNPVCKGGHTEPVEVHPPVSQTPAEQPKLRRAISYHEIISTKHKTMTLHGDFARLIGEPVREGVWFVHGKTGQGKTTFCLQLAVELAKYGTIAYNAIEYIKKGRKAPQTLKKAVLRANIKPIEEKFMVLPSYNLMELKRYLNRRKSPTIIFIDSLQYFKRDSQAKKVISFGDYTELINEFPNRLFIFIGHSEKGEAKHSIGKEIEFDADVKIRVEGYRAFGISRYGGSEPYTIWHEGVERHWNEEF
jgi:predicted ATP-dependent serine protease